MWSLAEDGILHGRHQGFLGPGLPGLGLFGFVGLRGGIGPPGGVLLPIAFPFVHASIMRREGGAAPLTAPPVQTLRVQASNERLPELTRSMQVVARRLDVRLGREQQAEVVLEGLTGRLAAHLRD